MLSNSPGNLGFEAAPFKLPLEYVEVLGGVDSEHYREFKRLFKDGFEAARKHCDRIVSEWEKSHPLVTVRLADTRVLAMVELMQKGDFHTKRHTRG